MRKSNVKFRVVLGLVGLTVSLVMLAFYLSVIPNRASAVREGRASLAEAIALHSTAFVMTTDFQRLAADFDLRDLPVTAELYEESHDWRQIKGDPAIRGLVFQQHREESLLDHNMETCCAILEELLTERGMFQGVIHFSSSRATIWLMDDPYRYRILDHEALSDPDICLLYRRRPYPDNALIPSQRIGEIIHGLSQLRTLDETLYLRSASINIFNGMISLTFSCDGSHYMPYQEFLDKNISFWIGSAA